MLPIGYYGLFQCLGSIQILHEKKKKCFITLDIFVNGWKLRKNSSLNTALYYQFGRLPKYPNQLGPPNITD